MTEQTSTGPVIVHVDDEQGLLDMSRLALQPLDVRFIPMLGAIAGLETVRFMRPALVLLDIMMPDMDGWELLRRVKADPDLSSVKIVIYSALTREADRARAQASGADDYLVKPCDPARLRQLIKDLTGALDRPRAKPGTPPTPSSNLPALDTLGMPGPVVDFVDRYLDSTITLELVTYLHDNPELYLTLPTAARALGRKAGDIEPALTGLVERSVVMKFPSDEGDLYGLSDVREVKGQTDAFFTGCEDPQVRVKAIYRIIRRKSQWR